MLTNTTCDFNNALINAEINIKINRWKIAFWANSGIFNK